MLHNINISRSIYIESCGAISSCGEVRKFDPEMHVFLDAWYAHQKLNNTEDMLELHHPDGAQHSSELVELCRRLAVPGPGTAVTLVYVHRGHHRQCKTPLLQTLLATLAPGLRVHGLRVEEARLPLDIVLFALAGLGEGDRCLIVKDNAIRLGTADAVSASDIRYLLLSRSKGPWEVESIKLFDEDPGLVASMAPLLLDDFSTDNYLGPESLSLASRTTTNRLGIINIAQVGAIKKLPAFIGS